jgi:hypothetical protein
LQSSSISDIPGRGKGKRRPATAPRRSILSIGVNRLPLCQVHDMDDWVTIDESKTFGFKVRLG